MSRERRYSGNGNQRQATRRAREIQALARSRDPNLTVGLPGDPQRAFAEIIFRQLAPFLTKSEVFVLVNGSANDAQKIANQRHEPVAAVDEQGLVMAFREPE